MVRRRTSQWPSLGAEDENALADWIVDPERHKAMHDAKGPLLAIWARGWDLAGLTSDTQIAAYLTRPDQRTFDLADLTIRYLKRELRVEGAHSSMTPTAGAGFRRRRLRRQGAAEASMVRGSGSHRSR
jgi:DNA polymerase-1